MQVAIKTTEGLGRRVSLIIPKEEIAKETQAELLKTAKTVRMDGFRKGKVPLNIVKQRFGMRILQDSLSELMKKHLAKTLTDNEIEMVGAPSYKPEKYEEGKDFSFSVDFEVYPEIEINGLDKIEIEDPKVEIQDSDVDVMIETLRKQQSTWKTSTNEIKDDTKVKLDFIGSIDGEEFEGGKAENFDLVTGQGRMIPGFENGILGRKAGENFVIDVTFPEDYQAEKLKGKKAQFNITIKQVEERVLPELNEEFIKLLGVKNGSLDALKDEVRKNMQRELSVKLRNALKNQLVSGLIANNEFAIPKAMVEMEQNELARQAASNYGGKNIPAEFFKSEAEQRVKVSVMFNKLIKENDIKPNEEKVDKLIADIASAYENPEEVIQYYKTDREMLNRINLLAVEDSVVDFLLKKVKITEKNFPFTEFMIKNSAI